MKKTSPNSFREASMLAKAKKGVMESAEWLSIASREVGDWTSEAVQLQEWERAGLIFSIDYNGSQYFPAYGLDQGECLQVLPVMADVISVLGRTKKGWGMAFWFASVSSYLGGRRPQDLLKSEPSLVLAAAKDELVGITHG